MRSATAIALDSYLVPMLATRAVRIGILLFLLVLGILGALVALGVAGARFLPDGFIAATMAGARKFFLVPGLPIAAILFSELPLRDGIRQRTLLYNLLTPVPRTTLGIVRTLVTALLLGVGGTVLVALTRVFEGASFAPFPREALAQFLSAFAFIALFSVAHLVARRGLFAALAYLLILDAPLARVPFAIRRLSMTYHVRVIADQPVNMDLPVPVTPPADSFLLSVTILVLAAVVFTALGAWLFNRKNLPEIC